MKHKILYPTDGSDTASSAIKYVVEAAKLTNSSVLVLNVVEKMPKALKFGLESHFDAELKKASKKILEVTVKKIKKSGIEAEAKVVLGIPHEVIVKLAKKEKANLIIMGTQGLSGLARFMLGSVADRVIRNADCPVLLIPYKAGKSSS